MLCNRDRSQPKDFGVFHVQVGTVGVQGKHGCATSTIKTILPDESVQSDGAPFGYNAYIARQGKHPRGA